MKCSKDNTVMVRVSTVRKLLDRDEWGELTEGQEADYMAATSNDELAESSDFFVTETKFRCPKCGMEIIVRE